MISVIIPTYNEEKHIQGTIRNVLRNDTAGLVKEIIVADGGSTDATLELARSEGIRALLSPRKGRAAQMNFGAALANQEILYFLHADTIPPAGFTNDIVRSINDKHAAGCFMLQFDHPHWFLKANCWFTRFDIDAFRYGDQSLFVRRQLFTSTGGFCEKHLVFEDYQIIKQLKKHGSFAIIRKPVITSARKYLDNGVFKMQAIFYLIYFMYRFGRSQPQLVSLYKRLIKQDKL